MNKRKPGYIIIAEHFGADSEAVRDHEYQPGRYSKPVYDINDVLWAGGKIKPKALDGSRDDFKKETSSYDGQSVLWYLDPNADTLPGIAAEMLEALKEVQKYLGVILPSEDRVDRLNDLIKRAKKVLK